MRRIASIALVLTALIAASCEDDASSPETSSVSSTASPTATVRPLPTPQPSPTPRSSPLPDPTADEIATIEQVIALVRAGDEAGLRRLASGRMSPCETMHSGPGGGPVCREGEPEGTRVESIGTGRCDGALARLDDVQFLTPGARTATNVAAYRPTIAGGDAPFFQVLFDDDTGTHYFDVVPGRIAGFYDRCLTAAPVVLGAAVAQWVIPPPHTPFAGEGTFVRRIDEPGDRSPFVWNFPATRTSDEGYRVYPPVDAILFTQGLREGDRVCVSGWADDVGNVIARRLGTSVTDCAGYPRLSGIAVVDATIRAVLQQDTITLQELVAYHTEGCIEVAQLSAPPQCESGQPIGTAVEVITVVFCDGGPMPRPQVDQLIFNTFREPLELYAAVRPQNKSADGEEYRILLTSPHDDRMSWVNVTDNGIVGLWADCGAAEQIGAFDGEFVIPPQYERPQFRPESR